MAPHDELARLSFVLENEGLASLMRDGHQLVVKAEAGHLVDGP